MAYKENLSDPVRLCPNPACPFVQKFHRPAEHNVDAQVCSECGAALELASSQTPTTSAAALTLDEIVQLRVDEDIGQLVGEPIRLQGAQDRLFPWAAMIAGGAILGHAIATLRTNGPELVAFVVGPALLLLGLWRILVPRFGPRRLQPAERGFCCSFGGQRARIAYDQVDQVQLHSQPLRGRWSASGYRIDLAFRYQGRLCVITTHARERGEAFERWCEQLARLTTATRDEH